MIENVIFGDQQCQVSLKNIWALSRQNLSSGVSEQQRCSHPDQHLGYSLKDIYFVIYGIISEFADKGQFH